MNVQIYEEIRTLFPELNQVKNHEWVDITCRIWQEIYERSKWNSLMAVPFGIKSPGISLITHTKAVLTYALKMVEVMRQIHQYEQKIDLDILIISCILHDVDKLLATSPGENGSICITDVGLDYQHGFYSAYYAEKHGLPASIVTLLIDHTTYSTLAPDSMEGTILIMADLCDAELLKFMQEGVSSLINALGKSSNRQKAKTFNKK